MLATFHRIGIVTKCPKIKGFVISDSVLWVYTETREETQLILKPHKLQQLSLVANMEMNKSNRKAPSKASR